MSMYFLATLIIKTKLQEKRKSFDFLLSNAYLKTSLSLAALPILSRK